MRIRTKVWEFTRKPLLASVHAGFYPSDYDLGFDVLPCTGIAPTGTFDKDSYKSSISGHLPFRSSLEVSVTRAVLVQTFEFSHLTHIPLHYHPPKEEDEANTYHQP